MSADFVVGLLGTGTPTPAEDAGEAVRLLRFHGLEGLCVARSKGADVPLLPEGALAEMEAGYRTQGLHTTLVVEMAHRARAILAKASVPSVLFKGAALVADGTYADPGARRMDDADLLIPPDEVVRGVEALLSRGFRPVSGWDPAMVGWVDALTLYDTEAPPGTAVALDLHWRTGYDRLRFGGEGPSVLWGGADPETGLPDPEPHLVLVAEHVLKHLRFKVHLAAYGDLARLAQRVEDWSRVTAQVDESRLAHGLRALLAAVGSELDAPVPEALVGPADTALAHELAPSALVGLRRPVEGRLPGIVYRWRLLGSPGKVFEDLREATFPPNHWLRARYGRQGLRGWMRYSGDVLRWAAYRGRSPASPNQDLFDPQGRE